MKKGFFKPLLLYINSGYFMFKADQIAKELEDYLQGLEYVRNPEGLYIPVRYALSAGGKRIRPVLLVMAYNLYSDEIRKAFAAAAAMEIFHNFTLLHDDLMDNADVRRGMPTVHKKWNANTAILSGDVMLILACRYLTSASEGNPKPILDIALETFIGIMEGQQYDMEFETRDDVTEEEYIEMIRLKTSVLLAACLKIGALLAGAGESDANLLYRFGEKVGLAFQIQDDLLDVYGDPKVFGKKTGGDILCNKKTYLYINAYRRADAAMRKELDRWKVYDGDDPQSKIDAVKAVYDAVHVREQSEELIESLFDQAISDLAGVNLPDAKKAVLREYVKRLMNRVQ